MKPAYLLALAVAALAPAIAQAQTTSGAGGAVPIAPPPEEQGKSFTGFVAVGAAALPKFAGSKKYQPLPLIIADLRLVGVSFEIRGPGVRVNLIDQENGFVAGPAIELDFGRESKDGGTARGLDKIGTAVNVGGFVGYRTGGNENGEGQVQVELSVLKDVTEGKGLTATGEISYAVLRGPRWIASVDANLTYADKKSLRTYFGITPRESLTSGLAAYRPDSGLRDVGVGTTIGYSFTERWGAIGRLGYNRYIGEAGKSPIVKEGSRNEFLVGAGVSYRF